VFLPILRSLIWPPESHTAETLKAGTTRLVKRSPAKTLKWGLLIPVLVVLLAQAGLLQDKSGKLYLILQEGRVRLRLGLLLQGLPVPTDRKPSLLQQKRLLPQRKLAHALSSTMRNAKCGCDLL